MNEWKKNVIYQDNEGTFTNKKKWSTGVYTVAATLKTIVGCVNSKEVLPSSICIKYLE